ncbi:MAG: hypothetical protein Q9217_001815 [Psora testacea]
MSPQVPRRPLIAIVGATGTGKSQLAVSLAERFNGEIINGDALQIYEGLPITTNKITAEESKGIPHHLLGCIRLGEQPWTVRQFHTQATGVVDDIRSRGKLPILVGGTHYYTQSLLFPNSLVEEKRPDFLSAREVAERWPILEASTEDMLQELRRIDPAMAKRWHPKDRRKIRRSLEISFMTGKPASEIYSEQRSEDRVTEQQHYSDSRLTENLCSDELLVFWTHVSAAKHIERLDKRVDAMLSQGLMDEVQMMHNFVQSQKQSGILLDESHGIWIAIGYKEFLPYLKDKLEAQNLKQEGIERTKIATRQYAKRQTRWIRLRLLEAMREAGLSGNMFLLDASDISTWKSNVEALAHDVTVTFLDGGTLPPPKSTSVTAQEMLVAGVKQSSSAQYCEACDKTLMSEVEWVRHLKSKGHKAATKPKINWQALYPKTDSQ